MKNKDKNLKHSYGKKRRLFISIDIGNSPMLCSLRNLIDKAGNVFPGVRLSDKKIKLFIHDSASKEN